MPPYSVYYLERKREKRMQGGVKHGPCGRDIIASLTGRFPVRLLLFSPSPSILFLSNLFVGIFSGPPWEVFPSSSQKFRNPSTQKLTAIFWSFFGRVKYRTENPKAQQCSANGQVRSVA